jgi:DNA-binding CsgD family transcriptional regulator
VDASSDGDWNGTRRELSKLMDAAITDGAFGRELLQLVLALPVGVDPLFERYRAAAMVDHGDWDGLRAVFAGTGSEPIELRGLREILTAPVDRERLPAGASELHQKALFQAYEYQARRSVNALRHWAQRISGVYTEALWHRDDVPIGRHLRYRQLHDVTLLAVAESQGGRLDAAHALANEAQRLGDEAEAFRFVATDLSNLTGLAMGDGYSFELTVPARVCDSTGPSPVGCAEMILDVVPFLALREDDALSWSSRLLEYIAARIASPRWQLHAESWRVADQLRRGVAGNKTELAGLSARSRRATPGLKALPTFLVGFAQRKYESFEDAERLARRSGNVWLQVSALTWMTALDPRARAAHRLRVLLDLTGWRRPILVPSEVAADAALGLASLGERSEGILELALTADRPNVTTELIGRYIDDTQTPLSTRLAAVDALGRVGTTHAREILARLAQRKDEIGRAATRTAERPAIGLSEREIQVLTMAGEGMTNRQIGEKLFLSPHTIARHLANARTKMGAGNRAEAAVLLRRSTD